MRKTSSCVKNENGMQYLAVNGKMLPGLSYVTYLAENNRYKDFADAGYDLYSLCIFFSSNNLNEGACSGAFTKGIFDTDVPCFDEFDSYVKKIIQACPGAMIFPRLNVNLPEKWEKEHPDELCDKTTNPDKNHKRPCICSDVWASEVKRLIKIFVEHIEGSSYVNSIVGYQIAGGNTDEWLPYDNDAFSGKRSREKFAELVKNVNYNDTIEDYYQFLSDATCDRICEFAALIKELTAGKVVVGSFYGYSTFSTDRKFPHGSLHRMLKNENIDFYASPLSYYLYRPIGMNHEYPVPIHSIKLHGKLYFAENDTRTHLSVPPKIDNPYYQKPVWYGPCKEHATEILKMHFARSLINAHPSWWFDMWGGWYDDADYMAFMKQALQIAKEYKGGGSCARVALFVDELAIAKFAGGAITERICEAMRAMGMSGMPYDLYLAEDFDAVKDNYDAYVVTVLIDTDVSRYIKKESERLGKPLLRLDEDRLCGKTPISPAEFRYFYQQAGLFFYTNCEAVIFASDRYVFIHTVNDGELSISLPDKSKKLTEVFTGKAYDGPMTVKLGQSFLFEIK